MKLKTNLIIVFAIMYSFLGIKVNAFTNKVNSDVFILSQNNEDSVPISFLKNGEEFQLMEINGDWLKINANNTIGFIQIDYTNVENKFKFVQHSNDDLYLEEVFDGYIIEETKYVLPPVELLEWSEVKNIFKTGVDTKVTDILTGEVYYVRSFSNGLHADVEPVSVKDTNILKSTFNNVWSWKVRPVIVEIDGRMIAGSINGMPHAQGVNNNNGMNGQICIHFKGSSTHNGNASFTQLHQKIAQQAFDLSK